MCHFINIKRREPRPSCDVDGLLLDFIRRASLDAFWSRRPSTVDKNLREMKKLVQHADLLGILSPVAAIPRGPWTVEDSWGMSMAACALMRSLDPGINSPTLQYDTTRRLFSTFANYYGTTPQGMSQLTLMNETGAKNRLTDCPTYGRFFDRFKMGCHARMGDVYLPDQALSIDEVLALEVVLEDIVYALWFLC